MELTNREQETILTQFLLGQYAFEDLRTALSDYVEFWDNHQDDRYETGAHFHKPLTARVILRPETVRPVLEAYLDWKVDEEQLERWATVLQMFDAYSNPDGLSDEQCDDHMVVLWELLSDIGAKPARMSMRERVTLGLADLAELETWLHSRAV